MTTFEIVEKPIRTLMTVSGVEVVVGTQYDIALETAVVLHNETDFLGEPFDSFTYKINKDGLTSVNIGTVRVSFQTNKVGLPPIETLVENINLNTDFFFSDLVAPEEHFDRIKITSIAGRGSWLLNGNPIVPGQEIFYYDLVDNLKFIADVPGNMDSYSVLTWDTGNILGYHSQDNTITVNTFSEGAELILLSSSTVPVVDEETGMETSTYSFKIQNSIVDAPYEIEIDTNLYPTIGTNPYDLVKMEERDLPEQIIDTLAIHTRASVLDENGETIYIVTIQKDTDTVVENSITVTLTEVDGTIDNVNPAFNEIVLIIPITPIP